MSELSSLRAELNDLTRILQDTVTSGTEEWSPEWMARQGLLRRQVELAHRIEVLEGGAEVEVRLVGGAEERSEIEADFLGGFLTDLQEAVASVVQTLMHGSQARGALPADVLAASSLRVGSVGPGSFAVRMSGPERSQQLSLDEEAGRPPFDEAIDRVMDLLDATREEIDPLSLESAIAELRSPRAIGHVTSLARALARTGTSATLIGRSPFVDEPRFAELTSLSATRLQEVLSKTRQETSRVFMTGQLSGVRWTKGIFDLEIPYEDHVAVVSGRVSRDIRSAVSSLFDRQVRAELELTVTHTEFSDMPKQTYLLVGVTLVRDGDDIVPQHD